MNGEMTLTEALGRAFFVILAKRDGLATQDDVDAAMADLADARSRRGESA